MSVANALKKFIGPLVPAAAVSWELYDSLGSMPLRIAVILVVIITSFSMMALFILRKQFQAWLLILLGVALMIGNMFIPIEMLTYGGLNFSWVILVLGALIFLSGLSFSSDRYFYLGDDPLLSFGEFKHREENKVMDDQDILLDIFQNNKITSLTSAQLRSLTQLFVEKIHFEKAHFIALFRNNSCILYVDMFDDLYKEAKLSEKKRDIYLHKSVKIHELVQKLDDYLEHLETGSVFRFVIDVEQGGLIHYYINAHYYLVGVTVDQRYVNNCDSALENLTTEIRKEGGIGV